MGLGKSKRCWGSPPHQNPGQSSMASPAFLVEKPRRQPPHPPTRRNLVYSKPCSPCSSPPRTPRPPRPPPPPPSVVVSLEVGSLGVRATTKRPPAQRLQLPPLPSVVDFLEGASSAARVRRRQQRQRRRQQLQPSAEVSWEEDFFARFTSSLRI